MRGEPDLRRTFSRGGLVRLLYRLGRQAANGVLTLAEGNRSIAAWGPDNSVARGNPGRVTARTARPEVFVLRRGAAVCADGELAKRALVARLARAAGEASIAAAFEGGISAYPPGALHQLALAAWVRSHLESQLDGSLAELLEYELAGARLTLRADLAPEPLDETDRRMLAAMAQPRRLDQIWPLARTPRFRLLAFLHFLRTVGAVAVEGIAAERSAPVRAVDPRAAALRMLGVEPSADLDAVKRAYRRLARTLHPDLQPHVDEQRRRLLERRFAELTAAYEALV